MSSVVGLFLKIDMKLSAREFAAEAGDNAGSSPERLAALRAWLDRHETSDCSECRAVLRRLVRFACDPHLARPPTELRRIRWACSPAEMAAMPGTAWELFALACIIAAEQHPERFGTEDGHVLNDPSYSEVVSFSGELGGIPNKVIGELGRD